MAQAQVICHRMKLDITLYELHESIDRREKELYKMKLTDSTLLEMNKATEAFRLYDLAKNAVKHYDETRADADKKIADNQMRILYGFCAEFKPKLVLYKLDNDGDFVPLSCAIRRIRYANEVRANETAEEIAAAIIKQVGATVDPSKQFTLLENETENTTD
jgi:hypothetical protein